MQPSKRRKAIAISIVAAALGLGVFILARQEALAPRPERFARAVLELTDAEIMAQGASAPDDLLFELATTVEGLAARSTAVFRASDLGLTAAQVIDALGSQDYDAIDRVLEAQGVLPRGTPHSQSRETSRDLARAFLATATFDMDDISIATAVQDIRSEPNPRVGIAQYRSHADHRRPFLASSTPQELRIAAVRVPGHFRALDGTEFEGRWDLEFAYDTTGQTWVLIAHRLSGVPVGVLVPPLPI
jgi:hypothetical protein